MLHGQLVARMVQRNHMFGVTAAIAVEDVAAVASIASVEFRCAFAKENTQKLLLSLSQACMNIRVHRCACVFTCEMHTGGERAGASAPS